MPAIRPAVLDPDILAGHPPQFAQALVESHDVRHGGSGDRRVRRKEPDQRHRRLSTDYWGHDHPDDGEHGRHDQCAVEHSSLHRCVTRHWSAQRAGKLRTPKAAGSFIGELGRLHIQSPTSMTMCLSEVKPNQSWRPENRRREAEDKKRNRQPLEPDCWLL